MDQEKTTDAQNTRIRGSREVLQEERYLWMARAFAVMTVLAIICDIILLIALLNVTPVMRVQPFYLEIQDKEQQIISVARPTVETLDSDVLKEALVRQYILARYGMGADLKELEDRWGPNGLIYWMSEGPIYDEFVRKESLPLQDLAQKDNLIREIRITSVNKTRADAAGGSDIWKVEFEIQETNRISSKPTVTRYRADVATAFKPSKKGLTWSNRLKNPLGFQVVNFAVSRI